MCAGPTAWGGHARVPSAWLCLELCETQHWLRGWTWSTAGVSAFGAFVCILSTHLQWFLPRTQCLWYLSHRCFSHVSSSPWVLASHCRLPKCDLEPLCLHHKILLFLFSFFYLLLYLRHVSCLWLLIKFSVFWFCDLTFLLLAAPADTALSATFSGGDFSSKVTDEILESGAKNCSLWEPSENMWHNKLICVSHLEISDFLVTLNEACWLHLTPVLFVQHQLYWLTRGIKFAILFHEIKFKKLDYQLLWNYQHKLDFSSFWKFSCSLLLSFLFHIFHSSEMNSS